MEDVIKIRLRFPKARIEINNLMMENHGNCSNALVAASREFGLIQDNSFCKAIDENETTCQALSTAESILTKYLQDKKITGIDQHISSLNNNVHLFKTLEFQRTKCKIECLRMTPVIFDLILQQIECT